MVKLKQSLRDVADTKWFNRSTFIRKLQCNVFGHRYAEKCLLKSKSGKMWCTWCGRYVDKLYNRP